ncbi:hypothetical protein HNQ88_000247 [Aureibacter tunicatorum]|uniref:Secretion system C-terminal sorting domain-containing protein n=2 Tax=Aureibacter tunicatorum TaxID=866807 RepID=A0AAE3XK60_9BACT|nr:hypothetical protein [Aureibacter tunicatorum]
MEKMTRSVRLLSLLCFFLLIHHFAKAQVQKAEFFWNEDPGEGNGILMEAVDGSFDQSVEALIKNEASVPSQDGVHQLNIRVYDKSLEQWGPVLTTIVVAGNTSAPILKYEREEFETYAGIPVDISLDKLAYEDKDSPKGSIFVILSEGDNYTFDGTVVTPDYAFEGIINVPVKLSDGLNESNTHIVPVKVNPKPSTVVRAEYYWGEDPGEGNGTAIEAKDGSYDSFVEMLSAKEVDMPSAGVHQFSIRVQNEMLEWGPALTTIIVTGNTSKPLLKYERKEYITYAGDAVEILLSDLAVEDKDSDISSLRVILEEGNEYTIDGTSVTPNYTVEGTIIVPVKVTDGSNVSNTLNVPIIVKKRPSTVVSAEYFWNNDPGEGNGIPFAAKDGNFDSFSEMLQAKDVELPFESGIHQFNIRVRNEMLEWGPVLTTIVVLGDVENHGDGVPVITGLSNPLVIEQNATLDLALNNFVVTDSDSDFPADFTLTIMDGDNYTLQDNAITPDADFNGTLTVRARVNDGTNDSNIYPFSIIVNEAINQAPIITGLANDLSTNENTALTIELSDLTVTDADSDYPTDFTLTVLDGDNYTVEGTTITPAQDYVGELKVNVKVNDGISDSEEFEATVTVIDIVEEDEIPVITGLANDLSTNENTALTIELSDLTVTDADSDYPTDFTLTVLDGDNYTVEGTTITPAQDYVGELTVNVKVNDGISDSEEFEATVTVIDIVEEDEIPVITGLANDLSTNENTALTIELSDLTVTDADSDYPTDFTLTVIDGDNYTVNGTTITPAQDYVGELKVNVKVNDGISDSEAFEATVTVIDIVEEDEVPVITGLENDLSTNENTALTIDLSDLTVTDADSDYPTDFTLTVLDGDNYTVEGTTITPAQDYVGELIVNVKVNDGISDSEVFEAMVTVIDIVEEDEIPVITGLANDLSTNENTALTIELSDLIVTDADSNYPTDFTLTVIDGDNYTVNGTTITPDQDFVGELTVNVKVNDGISDSEVFEATVTVIDIVEEDEIPVITGLVNDLSTNENTALTIELSDLTVTDADSNYPTDFTLVVIDGDNYTVNGTTITPSQDFIGTLTVSLKVNDGVSDSEVFEATVTVIDVIEPDELPLILAFKDDYVLGTAERLTLNIDDLIIKNEGNVDLSQWQLVVEEGQNYSKIDNTIFLNDGFEGTVISVNMHLTNGSLTSESAALAIGVVLHQLEIDKAKDSYAVEEDMPFALTLDLLEVQNAELYSNISIEILEGENYQILDGGIIMPSTDFNGELDIPIRLVSNESESPIYDFPLLVVPVNDKPVIVSADTLEMQQNKTLQITLEDLEIYDVDSQPEKFFIKVLEGANYTFDGNEIVPFENYLGELSVAIQVSDGESVSEIRFVKVNVKEGEIVEPTSIEEVIYNMKIYPNPTTEKLYVDFEGAANMKFDIYVFDVSGKLLIHKMDSNLSNGIEVSSLPDGVYSLRILADKTEIYNFKFVKN